MKIGNMLELTIEKTESLGEHFYLEFSRDPKTNKAPFELTGLYETEYTDRTELVGIKLTKKSALELAEALLKMLKTGEEKKGAVHKAERPESDLS